MKLSFELYLDFPSFLCVKVFVFLVFLLLMSQYSYQVGVFVHSVLLESAMPYKYGYPTLIKLLVVPSPLLSISIFKTRPETVT